MGLISLFGRIIFRFLVAAEHRPSQSLPPGYSLASAGSCSCDEFGELYNRFRMCKAGNLQAVRVLPHASGFFLATAIATRRFLQCIDICRGAILKTVRRCRIRTTAESTVAIRSEVTVVARAWHLSHAFTRTDTNYHAAIATALLGPNAIACGAIDAPYSTTKTAIYLSTSTTREVQL
jgi:hypothetical protein